MKNDPIENLIDDPRFVRDVQQSDADAEAQSIIGNAQLAASIIALMRGATKSQSR